MYNFEKYIPATLDSVLAQTFQDYELIVVNDCSTDNSREIAESYVEKFGGRMRIYDNEKNSGPSASRNKGLRLAQGKYIFFMDADDLLTPDSLEGMYTLAEKFDVDFVSFTVRCETDETGKELIYPPNENVITPKVPEDEIWIDDSEKLIVLDSSNPQMSEKSVSVQDMLNYRIEILFKKNLRREIWLKFVNRKFLLENDLFFPKDIYYFEDHVWVYCIFFCAKRIAHVPRVFYLHRKSKNSLVRSKKTKLQIISIHAKVIINGIKWIDNVMSKIPFFVQNSKLRYIVLTYFLSRYLNKMSKAVSSIEHHEFYESLKDMFAEKFGENDVLISQLITYVNITLQKLQNQLKNRTNPNFIPYLTARIDIKLIAESDFQILSVSDEKAKLTKPGWFQKGGVGYVITSYRGNLNFIAKANVAGKIRLDLRGLNIHDLENKSKRIPYWIDYTKLIIDGEIIFDNLTPAWHDKPYKYTIDAKADKEIKIEIEWLPHRSDV